MSRIVGFALFRTATVTRALLAEPGATGSYGATRERASGELHLACTGREMVCRKLDNKHIRVGRRKFQILSYGCYIGNMMWDGARVDVTTANAIVDALRANGNYSPEMGTDDLWTAWDDGKPLFAAAPTASEETS